MPIPTPHIEAKLGDIAKTVLMPGDPLRAKFIADNFLENVTCYNNVRGMLGFTGEYNGKRISVQGSGMGMPSIGIYSYELFSFYEVENIIRIGSAGAIADGVEIGDLVIGMSASTNSRWAEQYALPGTYAPTASWELVRKTVEICDKQGVDYHIGNILSNDTFYDDDQNALLAWKKMGVICVEMEGAALYMNAARLGKNALTILTISDKPFGDSIGLSSEDRQNSFTKMMKVALELG